MATEASPVTAPGSVDALKRVKAVESEWDGRLAAAREATETELRRLHDEADAAVKAAQAEADRGRADRVEHARAETAGMAAKILAEGQKAAEAAARGEGRRPADKKDAILDVILGSFGKD